MGLYISDLRLPADGDFELWIAVRKDGSFTYNVRGNWQDGKQKAVLIPEHGKLIDADVMKTKMVCSEYWEKVLIEWIDEQKTVIPASKEEM